MQDVTVYRGDTLYRFRFHFTHASAPEPAFMESMDGLSSRAPADVIEEAKRLAASQYKKELLDQAYWRRRGAP